MLPFTFVAAQIFAWPRDAFPSWAHPILQPRTAYLVLGLIVLANGFLQKKDYYDKPDFPRMVADYLEKELNEKDVIYPGNYQQVIYHLLGRSSPSRYVHFSLMWKADRVYALKIDLEEELKRIKATRPRFILVGKELVMEGQAREAYDNYIASIGPWLETDYYLSKSFNAENIRIYERR